jgi:hypothetical protein
MISLDIYGAACRCLLRIRENHGNPWISDASFISQYLDRYPQWNQRPGELSGNMLQALVVDMGLASSLGTTGNYDEVLHAHRSGKDILIQLKDPSKGEAAELTMLLERMDQDTFTLWCPYQSGQSAVLEPQSRDQWSQASAQGLILQPLRKIASLA